MDSALLEAVAAVPGVRVRPTPDPAGDAGTSLIFHVADAAQAQWAGQALQAEGVLAGPLLSAAGSNRHWAGDWSATLLRCGITPPSEDVVAQDRKRLAGAVHLPVNIAHRDSDVDETCVALSRVLRATVERR